MIVRLSIQNLILIEQADIAFGPGLNIITGETGSGKSALLSAIRLLLGAKADPQQIRSQASLSVVEAQFIPSEPLDWLAEEEIAAPASGPVSIRREIHRSGKNRCFFEDQQISLTLLKKIVGAAIELVDQSSSLTLSLSDEQRKWLDAFGKLSSMATAFAKSFEEEKALETSLAQYLAEMEKADLEQLRAEENLAWIEEINLQEGEEERLAQEHDLLTHSQQLLEAATSAVSLLSESSQPLLFVLKRMAHSLEQVLRFDPRLTEPYEGIKQAFIGLEEASFTLRSYADRLDADPTRLAAIEERFAAIEKIKKRFGPLSEIKILKQHLSKRLDDLSQLGSSIAATRSALSALREKNRLQAEEMTQLRLKAAHEFEEAVTQELRSLNLPHARFEITVSPKEMSAHGADALSFHFTANPGYSPLPLEECASGGELSRLLLAIKTVLADRDKSTCLIFDEIDSNVGGQTAAILGAKLQKLSEKRQTICVTHFVQVARCAFHHFLVSKDQAITTVRKLSGSEQEMEFRRMLGQGTV